MKQKIPTINSRDFYYSGGLILPTLDILLLVVSLKSVVLPFNIR